VLWLIGAGTLAYFLIGHEVSHWKWQYVHIMRNDAPDPNEVDWSLPYYEIMRSPSGELTVTFDEVGYDYVQSWDQSVKDGKLTVVKMPDGSYQSTNVPDVAVPHGIL